MTLKNDAFKTPIIEIFLLHGKYQYKYIYYAT